MQLHLNLRCRVDESDLPALRRLAGGGRVEIGALHLSYAAPPPRVCPYEFAKNISSLVADGQLWEEASQRLQPGCCCCCR